MPTVVPALEREVGIVLAQQQQRISSKMWIQSVFVVFFSSGELCEKSANTKWKWKWRNCSTSPAHLNKKSKEMIMQWRKQRGDRWDETKWREERWETTLYCSLFILLIYYLCSVPTSSSPYACQGKGEGAIFRGCDAWTWSGEESTS